MEAEKKAEYTDLASIHRLAKVTDGKTWSSVSFIITSEYTGMCSTFSCNGYQLRRWFKTYYRQSVRDLFIQ